MPDITIGSQRLHWRDEGHGPIVLCLHANPGDSRDFDAVAPALARRHRLIRLDWPGYGGSPAPQPAERAGAFHFHEVLRDFIDRLQLRHLCLLGNSVGGNAAVRYALEAPGHVRALILVSPGGFTRHTAVSRGFCRLQGHPLGNRLLARVFVRSYLRRRTEWTRAMIARADGEQSAPDARRVNAAVWRSFLHPDHDLRQRAGAVQAPTLVLSGAHDPVIPARTDGAACARAIPGARQVVLDCGHAPFAELPEAFLGEVLPFLDAVFAAEPRRATA